MTVSNPNATKTVTLATGTDAISTLIHILDEDHLTVTRNRSNVITTLNKPSDYTVSDVDVEAGCTVTMVGQQANDIITITRNVPFTQQGDYVSGSVFPPEVNEDGHDKAVMLAQQLQEQIDRCVRLPVEDSGTDYGQEIPKVQLRSGTTPSVDTSGNIVWGSGNGNALAAFGSASIESVASAGTENVVDITVPTDQTAYLTVMLAIEGRSYAKLQKFLLINDADSYAKEDGWIEEYAANAIGGEYVDATCTINAGKFRVAIDGTGLTGTRNVHIRWKIETFNNNGTITYTEL